MRSKAVVALVVLLAAGVAEAGLPIRAPEAVSVVVEKVVPATDAEKEKGTLATVFLKDRKKGIAVTKDTPLHKQMGKLVPVAEVGDIKAGATVSIWIDAKTGAAEAVLIFP